MRNLKKLVYHPITIRIITVALNFIANVLINRSLGIEMKGQMTRIQNYANIFQLIFNLGICYAYPMLIQKFGGKKARIQIVTLIWIQTFICTLITSIILCCNFSVENLITSALFIAMLCNGQIVFIALIDNIKERNRVLLLSTIGYILLNAIAIVVAPGNLYLILAFLIAKYLVEVFIYGFKLSYFTFSIKSLDNDFLKLTLSIGIPTAVVAVLISCNYNIDIFMLDWFKCSDTQVGIFGVAYSLSNMLWFIPDAFKEMIYNRTARENKYRFVLKYIFINMLLCAIICIGFGVLGEWFLSFVYGSEYIAAYDVCITLFIGIIPMVAFKLIHPIYINNGRVVPVVFLLTISVLTNFIFSYFLIPQKGAFGAALACVGSYSICGLMFFIMFYNDYCRKE